MNAVLHEQMHGWTNAWMHDWMNEWIETNEFNAGMAGMNAWLHEWRGCDDMIWQHAMQWQACMNERMIEIMHECTH